MAKHILREEARKLRQQGMSVKQIEKQLGVSRSSVSLWVRDIQLLDEQIEVLQANRQQYGSNNYGSSANRDRFMIKRLNFQEAGRIKARENSPLHLAGCMLYWAEGSKTRNKLDIVNSDPNMIKLFVRFLREEMKLNDIEICLTVLCHTNDSIEINRIQNFWLHLLNLPTSCLRKAQYKEGTGTRKNIHVNEMCSIRVHRTDILQHIYGAIQEYAGFENPAWLF